jgi:plastocyanin
VRLTEVLVLTTIALLAASLARAATHTVAVGANGNTFDPTSITANPGDVITFSFKGGSHTVTQSTFASPCTALQGGVDSGSKPAAGAATPPTFNYTVADTKSVWFYCQTGTHCKSGMVFAVNPTSTQTFGAFQNAAKGDSSSTNSGNGYGYGYGGASGRASIGFGAVAGALTLGALAAI